MNSQIKEKEEILYSIKQVLVQINTGMQPSASAAASSSGAGRFKLRAKAKSKAKSRPTRKAAPRLKPIQEDEEERIIIKPAKQHLSSLDMNNDPPLINKVRGKEDLNKYIISY